ncbi:SGNH/GDSL hydrolase family protein [Pilimelia columellifera]|uniref:SGNH/GDSL hydrolase family protein n=1 Tax=Pilimelia columellifera subsp. columellifera TaxID=706583 RepID=A0ABN3N3D4_9ACTN
MDVRASRRVISLLSFLLVAATTAVVAPASAFAAASPTRYVSLGDSYSAGVGAGDYDAASGSCRRSRHAYPRQWVAAHAGAVATYLACSGADTATLLRDQAPGVPVNATLVTVSIGGNDVGFGQVIAACVASGESKCANAVNTATGKIENALPARLDAVYRDLRRRAPGARLVVLGYPRLYELNMACASAVSATKRRRLNGAADALAAVTKARAEAAGAAFVDVRPRFVGHGLCGAPSWIKGLIRGIPHESYHPDRTGQISGYLPALSAAAG